MCWVQAHLGTLPSLDRCTGDCISWMEMTKSLELIIMKLENMKQVRQEIFERQLIPLRSLQLFGNCQLRSAGGRPYHSELPEKLAHF